MADKKKKHFPVVVYDSINEVADNLPYKLLGPSAIVRFFLGPGTYNYVDVQLIGDDRIEIRSPEGPLAIHPRASNDIEVGKWSFSQ
jgi:hypothetical protein